MSAEFASFAEEAQLIVLGKLYLKKVKVSSIDFDSQPFAVLLEQMATVLLLPELMEFMDMINEPSKRESFMKTIKS